MRLREPVQCISSMLGIRCYRVVMNGEFTNVCVEV
jgi:hypothetical protein